MTLTRTAAPLALVAAVAVAGCGSSNKQLSYSDFIAKANATCRNGNAEVAKATSPADEAARARKAVDAFKKLKPPSSLKPAFDQFVAISDKQVAAMKAGDAATANQLSHQSDVVASKLGAADCITKK